MKAAQASRWASSELNASSRNVEGPAIALKTEQAACGVIPGHCILPCCSANDFNINSSIAKTPSMVIIISPIRCVGAKLGTLATKLSQKGLDFGRNQSVTVEERSGSDRLGSCPAGYTPAAGFRW
jgi:hypothetical protein